MAVSELANPHGGDAETVVEAPTVRSPLLVLRPAWRRDNAELERDVVAFWRRLNLLPPGVSAEARAKSLCMVAYKGGEVAAVAVAVIEYNALLRARLAMYQCAISPQHRRGPVVAQLAEGSRLLLMDWARKNPEEKVKGMGTITETPISNTMRLNPIWRYRGLRLNLIGWTAEGYPVRVQWFAGVRLEPGEFRGQRSFRSPVRNI